MRFLEEKVINKPRKDWKCESCGKELPKGEPHLQEKYTDKGTIISYRYCLNKKCNPPNDVRHRLFVVASLIVVGVVIWGVVTYAI